MKLNKNMRSLLDEYAINSIDCLPENSTYPVWHKTDAAGRSYWGVSSFWGLDNSKEDLSQLEWDGNEVYLEAQSDEETTNILRQGIGITVFWKNELETKYPGVPFYIFASYDNGDMMVLDEGELPTRSVTLRFWADRGSDAVINLDDFEDWKQPAIIEYCNFAPPK